VDEEEGRTTEEWKDGLNKKDNDREESNDVKDEEVEADNDLECEVDNVDNVDNVGKCTEGTLISAAKGEGRGVKGESELNREDLSGK
jgi:hypothetical protein